MVSLQCTICELIYCVMFVQREAMCATCECMAEVVPLQLHIFFEVEWADGAALMKAVLLCIAPVSQYSRGHSCFGIVLAFGGYVRVNKLLVL